MPALRTALIACVILLAAGGGYIVGPRLRPTPAVPAIDCQDEVDFGEREQGEMATARLSIANRGGAELVIGRSESSCSCSGLELDAGDRVVAFDELRFAPGETKSFVVRLSVRGNPGEPIRHSLSFPTNDPARPVVQLSITVPRVRGLASAPNNLTFGEIPVGETVRRHVDVYELGGGDSVVERVTCHPEGMVTAEVQPPQTAATGEARRHLGGAEVSVRANSAGDISGTVTFLVRRATDRATVTVAVNGRAVRPVELSPSTLVLPRRSDAGPVHTADCFCRSTGGGALDLTVVSADPDLSAEVLPAEVGAPVRVVRVVYRPQPEAGPSLKTVRLAAACGGHKTTIELTVDCRP